MSTPKFASTLSPSINSDANYPNPTFDEMPYETDIHYLIEIKW